MKRFIIVICLLSCSSPKPEIPQLKLGKNIVLDFEDTPMYQVSNSWGFNEESFYYTSDHADSLGLYIFDFEKKKWKADYFSFEGPNGLRRYDDFIIINDTLAFHSLSGYFGFQLIQLKSGEVEDFFFRETMINPGNITFRSIYFDGDIIGFPITEYKKTSDQSYTKESNIYGFFSLRDKQFQRFIPFPGEFHEEVYSSNFLKHHFLVNGDSVIVNFQKSKNVFIYDMDGNLLFQKEVKAKNVNTSNPGRKPDQMDNMVLTEFSGKYSSLIKIGTGFLRIAITYPNITIPSVSNMKSILTAAQSCEMHVLMLDKNFELLSEGYFPCMPGNGGIGDGMYFVQGNKLFLWSLNKGDQESIEVFHEILLE